MSRILQLSHADVLMAALVDATRVYSLPGGGDMLDFAGKQRLRGECYLSMSTNRACRSKINSTFPSVYFAIVKFKDNIYLPCAQIKLGHHCKGRRMDILGDFTADCAVSSGTLVLLHKVLTDKSWRICVLVSETNKLVRQGKRHG
ncbi:hypothetical protein RRG08_016553 [Elysia crispata]|uniref:Uncharacterized protein n=1 Tax=Elysia crispata TaxID=231223 RepID=A0AAE0Y3A8_9GAST|nr:hypothetical protein RRG08_016553 [Elysia crispata]